MLAAAAHLRVTRLHLLIVLHLIHRGLLVMLTSGLSRFAGVHLRLVVSVHVFPVALMFALRLVFVACDFSGSAIPCTRTLPITFTRISAVISRFPWSSSRSRIGTFLT